MRCSEMTDQKARRWKEVRTKSQIFRMTWNAQDQDESKVI